MIIYMSSAEPLECHSEQFLKSNKIMCKVVAVLNLKLWCQLRALQSSNVCMCCFRSAYRGTGVQRAEAVWHDSEDSEGPCSTVWHKLVQLIIHRERASTSSNEITGNFLKKSEITNDDFFSLWTDMKHQRPHDS